jgi:hypothetical protein
MQLENCGEKARVFLGAYLRETTRFVMVEVAWLSRGIAVRQGHVAGSSKISGTRPNRIKQHDQNKKHP